MRILIVDDETLILQGIQYVIKKMNTEFKEIDIAASGPEAVEMMQQKHYDLLLTDICMPIMSGLELIQKAKELNLCKRFCVLSGYSEFEYAQKALQLGASDYLLKPVDKEELQKLLQKTYCELQASTIEHRKQIEGQINDILFCGAEKFPIDYFSEEQGTLLLIAAAEPQYTSHIPSSAFQPLYDNKLAQLVIRFHHYPAFMFLAEPAKNQRLRHALGQILSGSSFSFGSISKNIEDADQLRFCFALACQSALCAKYLTKTKNLNSFQPPEELNSDILFWESCLSTTISKAQFITFQASLSNLLGSSCNYLDMDTKNPYIKQILSIIHEHFREELPLHDIAARVGLNADYAGKLFKQQMGTGYLDYLNFYRISQILQNIQRNPALSFEQIAPLMGFKDIRNFYRVFRRIMNMSPNEYLASIKNG